MSPTVTGSRSDIESSAVMTADAFSEIDAAWSEFRRQLELGRELEIVDENGDPIDIGGDYPDKGESEPYD